MNRITLAGWATLAATQSVWAGGVDRSGQSVAVIFEAGNYFEASFGSASPSVSGVGTAASPTPGGASGDASPSYNTIAGAYKHSFGNGFDAALIFDQPFGALVSYPVQQPYFARGSMAELTSEALTAVLKYKFDNNVSVFGGLRYQTFASTATVPFVTAGPTTPGVVTPGAPYVANGARDSSMGYLVGIGYERPDIALRIALTYNSKIKHSLDTIESSAFGGPVRSQTEVTTPQSVNLEFQTGVAKDTLLFGSVRWVEWSEFDISPTVYQGMVGQPLVSFKKDRVSYTLGVGRRLNDTWSVAATIGFEDQGGGFSSNLGPTDGYTAYGLGATYTNDRVKVTAGVRYVDIGNAQTTLNATNPASEFRDNHAIGFGVKVGYTF